MNSCKKNSKRMKTKENQQIISHFTSVENLFKILDKGLKFSDASQWDDKNDKYGIDQYKKLQNGKNVLVLCFCDGSGNAYHWTRKHNQKKHNTLKNIQCSINFHKTNFFRYIESFENVYEHQYVEYCRNKEVSQKTIEKIPYIKRKEYEIEKEIRILYIGEKKNVYIPIIKYIQSITLEKVEDVSIEQNIKHRIEHYIASTNINGYSDSEVWQRGIDTIIKNNHK